VSAATRPRPGAYAAALQFCRVEVRNIRWLGIPTDRYDEMVAFFRDVLQLKTNFEEPTTIELETTEGDEVQVFAPGDRYYDFFKQHATGPVALFEVDDVHGARAELDAAGIEIVGTLGRDSTWEWIHFRAPDGNLYELASRLDAS
jgi:catechol 2,3-dioxygenase-like lactoylglutathione lyase family enzyme